VWNATIPGSSCPGVDFNLGTYIGQEDCLYLNVYTPKLPVDIRSDKLMNVVVHIHGGAYIGGQGINYGPEYILDSNDFVYVTINYRLGVLGFAATGDNVLPGNNGMKDQVAALKWIQRNIGAFGGSSDDITITGLSAGASSVHYHMISPMSKGLFNRAIIQSGSAYCNWAYTENVIQKTKYVAKMLGCPTDNSMDIVECLRTRSTKAITESIEHFMSWRSNPFTPFGPTIEPIGGEQFLPDIPEKLIPYDVPVLMSHTQDEALDMEIFISFGDAANELNNNWNEILPHLLDYNYTISNESQRTKIAQDIKEFYFGDKIVSNETRKIFSKMYADRMMGYAMSNAAQNIASKNTAPVYYHEFGYSGNYSVITSSLYYRGLGVNHCDDALYILKTYGKSPDDNEEDLKMIKIMNNIWGSFIKNGVPYIGYSETWLPVSKNNADPFRYLKITQNQTFELKEDSNYGNYEFWSSLPLNEFYETNIPENNNHIEL